MKKFLIVGLVLLFGMLTTLISCNGDNGLKCDDCNETVCICEDKIAVIYQGEFELNIPGGTISVTLTKNKIIFKWDYEVILEAYTESNELWTVNYIWDVPSGNQGKPTKIGEFPDVDTLKGLPGYQPFFGSTFSRKK